MRGVVMEDEHFAGFNNWWGEQKKTANRNLNEEVTLCPCLLWTTTAGPVFRVVVPEGCESEFARKWAAVVLALGGLDGVQT
jgi:hypothetical protein